MSIRTIKFGDAFLKWNTAFSYEIIWKREKTIAAYKKYIDGKLKVNTYNNIRHTVYDLVYNCIKNKEVSSMSEFWYLILALRLTEIDCTEYDDEGNFKVYLLKAPDGVERCTFSNIRYHINNHCTKTYLFCKVQTISSRGRKAISYTTGEWKDEFGDGLDRKCPKNKPYYYKRNKRNYIDT